MGVIYLNRGDKRLALLHVDYNELEVGMFFVFARFCACVFCFGYCASPHVILVVQGTMLQLMVEPRFAYSSCLRYFRCHTGWYSSPAVYKKSDGTSIVIGGGYEVSDVSLSDSPDLCCEWCRWKQSLV